jgi:hypothetical protein
LINRENQGPSAAFRPVDHRGEAAGDEAAHRRRGSAPGSRVLRAFGCSQARQLAQVVCFIQAGRMVFGRWTALGGHRAEQWLAELAGECRVGRSADADGQAAGPVRHVVPLNPRLRVESFVSIVTRGKERDDLPFPWLASGYGQAPATIDLYRMRRTGAGCGETGSFVRRASAHAPCGTGRGAGPALPLRRRTRFGQRCARAVSRRRRVAGSPHLAGVRFNGLLRARSGLTPSRRMGWQGPCAAPSVSPARPRCLRRPA